MLRISRSLRPWSLVGRNSSMSITFNSLVNSLRAMGNVAFVATLVWITYAILGTQLFGSQLYACTTPGGLYGDQTFSGRFIQDAASCTRANFTWVNYNRNFNNVGESMLTLFGAATTDAWSDVLYMTTSVTEVGRAPLSNNKPFLALFLVSFMIVMTFFLLNVFVSILVDTFFDTKRRVEDTIRNSLIHATGDDLLAPDEQEFVEFYRRVLVFVKEPIAIPYGPDSWRHKVRRVVRSKYTDQIFFGLVVVHIAVMGSQHFEESDGYSKDLHYADLCFTLLFTGYTISQCITFGVIEFVGQSALSRIEAVNNIATLVITSLRIVFPTSLTLSALAMLRCVRLFRVFWLTTGLRMLTSTMARSAESIAATLFIVLLVFFNFACIGQQLFGRVRWVELGPFTNFANLGAALVTLLRVTTFDNWQAIMWNTAYDPPDCNPNLGNCGKPIVAPIFFFLFVFFGQWMGVNCFTAVLLQSFANAEVAERSTIQEEHVLFFQKHWKCFTGLGRTTLSFPELVAFLMELPPPLGVDVSGVLDISCEAAPSTPRCCRP